MYIIWIVFRVKDNFQFLYMDFVISVCRLLMKHKRWIREWNEYNFSVCYYYHMLLNGTLIIITKAAMEIFKFFSVFFLLFNNSPCFAFKFLFHKLPSIRYASEWNIYNASLPRSAAILFHFISHSDYVYYSINVMRWIRRFLEFNHLCV